MKKLLLFTLILLSAGVCYSDTGIDSLKKQLDETQNRAKKIQLYMQIASLYMAENKVKPAIDTYHEAMGLLPKKKELFSIWISLGNIQLSQKQYAVAIESYKNAEKLLPKDANIKIRLASAYEQGEMIAKAEQEYLRAIKDNNKSLSAHYGLGCLYLKQGFNTPAFEHFKVAAVIEDDIEILRKTAECAANLNNIDYAVSMLKQVVLRENNYSDIINLGRLYEQKGAFTEAENEYLKAQKTDSERWEAYIYLGMLYTEQKRYREAEKIYKKAVEKLPKSETPHFLLSILYLNEGRLEDAKREVIYAKKLAENGSSAASYLDNLKTYIESKM